MWKVGDKLKLNKLYYKETLHEQYNNLLTFHHYNNDNISFTGCWDNNSKQSTGFMIKWFELEITGPLTEFQMLDKIKENIENDY